VPRIVIIVGANTRATCRSAPPPLFRGEREYASVGITRRICLRGNVLENVCRVDVVRCTIRRIFRQRRARFLHTVLFRERLGGRRHYLWPPNTRVHVLAREIVAQWSGECARFSLSRILRRFSPRKYLIRIQRSRYYASRGVSIKYTLAKFVPGRFEFFKRISILNAGIVVST